MDGYVRQSSAPERCSRIATVAALVVATAAFLMGRDGSFITGSDLLIDGGVIAAITTGRYQLHMG
jgi:hypothetical protein